MNNLLNELVAQIEHQRIIAQMGRRTIENAVRQIADDFLSDKRQRRTQENRDDVTTQS